MTLEPVYNSDVTRMGWRNEVNGPRHRRRILTTIAWNPQPKTKTMKKSEIKKVRSIKTDKKAEAVRALEKEIDALQAQLDLQTTPV